MAAPITGIDAFVETEVGQLARVGSSFFLMAPMGEPAVAVAIAGPQSLTALAVGHDASLEITSVNSQTRGRLRASVTSIGELPLTRARLESPLGDSAELFGHQAPLYEALVLLMARS